MDMPAFDRDAVSRELRKTRALALSALVSGLGVIGGVALVLVDLEEVTLLFIAGCVVLQVVLGLLGFGVGRRGVERIKALRLPVELTEAGPLRRWSIFSLVVAICGVLGGLLLVGLVLLIAAAGAGMAGGAWGRPLRVGSRTVGATLRTSMGTALERGHRWADGHRPRVEPLDEATRHALGMMWLHDASKEHGSVPAFAQLTWQLAALGAPAELLARCQHSALQEIDHAQRCFAAAEAYLDTEIGVGPIPAIVSGSSSTRGPVRLACLVARQTLEDGCFIEDLNADFAERAHTLARDSAMRSLTACIAREEREHAALAWDILRFCVELHPRVAAHVRSRLDRLPIAIEIPYAISTMETIARADPQALAEHGRVPFDEWTPLFEMRRERTLQRVRALLDEVGSVAGLAQAHLNAS
ncbi:hypothetical protein [Paraliomyxa miuraensis]|uniref:hypothetical protein n=1 Tax=Paraliomyxa miuraensis TaxID=376150 RepID=UPI002255D6A4|nr:hypothetical protein [Paraliomyxa miuraensis]MCX4248010.1 hypothetical protein [Paraliomyxa miuraensis]